MIDYFALALTHGLILLALIRLAGRDALDRDPALSEGDRPKINRKGDTTGPRDA